ncbi:NUC189-domain-containing protein [Basidiobolus meristosporus CBS 931.73]|uniref:NUC189-domain-containing protein n=1 Tax=Basidiobolus meristosporus CBS 931.73 TaxID=1314790 RepID=A0A1Y1Y2X1_9FUNG|nr:NUC189-domain-containing protein [Basidiobolus meristosporus CBS 931.73]|eukprot:ORX92225.1 NUC189-domain-containing protein [Basidiobolus meristosporus CBS 931.73]
MVKKKTLAKQFHNSLNTQVAEAIVAKFDSEADLFAIVTQAVDRHRLRIFDTHTGSLKSEFSSDSERKFTCMSWGITQIEGMLSESGVSCLRASKVQPAATSKVVALGLENGSVIVYSVALGTIQKTLSGGHTLPVRDFIFSQDGSKGYSCAPDGYLVEWDLKTSSVARKWKSDIKDVHTISLSHNESVLAVAAHSIELWDLESQQVIKKFTGHASVITNLVFSPNDEICISCAEHDRFVNLWDCRLEGDRIDLASLTLDADITQVEISKSNNVLALSEEGVVSLWENLISSSSMSSKPSKKKKRYTTRPSDSIIKILSTAEESAVVPILVAKFVSKGDGVEVLVARGSTLKPSFERVAFRDEENGSLLTNVEIRRDPTSDLLLDQKNIASNNLQATQKTYGDDNVVVLGATDMALPDPSIKKRTEVSSEQEPTIEEKLKDLAVTETADGAAGEVPTNKAITPKANSLVHILVQALHSNDVQLLEGCLNNTNTEIINNTVKRLPPTYVIPFLAQVIPRFQAKPNRGIALLRWIKAVLTIHTAYLMTVPELVKHIGAFYQTADNRLGSFQKLLALSSRLDLVTTQLSMRTTDDVVEEFNSEPTNVYIEGESDEEYASLSDEDMADA